MLVDDLKYSYRAITLDLTSSLKGEEQQTPTAMIDDIKRAAHTHAFLMASSMDRLTESIPMKVWIAATDLVTEVTSSVFAQAILATLRLLPGPWGRIATMLPVLSQAMVSASTTARRMIIARQHGGLVDKMIDDFALSLSAALTPAQARELWLELNDGLQQTSASRLPFRAITTTVGSDIVSMSRVLCESSQVTTKLQTFVNSGTSHDSLYSPMTKAVTSVWPVSPKISLTASTRSAANYLQMATNVTDAMAVHTNSTNTKRLESLILWRLRNILNARCAKTSSTFVASLVLPHILLEEDDFPRYPSVPVFGQMKAVQKEKTTIEGMLMEAEKASSADTDWTTTPLAVAQQLASQPRKSRKV